MGRRRWGKRGRRRKSRSHRERGRSRGKREVESAEGGAERAGGERRRRRSLRRRRKERRRRRDWFIFAVTVAVDYNSFQDREHRKPGRVREREREEEVADRVCEREGGGSFEGGSGEGVRE